MYVSNAVKLKCKCGRVYYCAKGSNCDVSGLCFVCIKKKQDKTGKFWQGDKHAATKI